MNVHERTCSHALEYVTYLPLLSSKRPQVGGDLLPPRLAAPKGPEQGPVVRGPKWGRAEGF